MSAATEARRQGALIEALQGREPGPDARLAEHGARLRRGLAAYRGNAAAVAERALANAYPTLTALVGGEDAAMLARALWRQAPPTCGDLAQWGDDLPALIEAQRELDAWPYLADCARLDAALRRCEQAADATLDAASLGRLADCAPQAVRLHLLPSVQLLASRWPIAALYAAHHAAGVDASVAVGAALAAPRGESVVIARRGWRAEPVVVAPADFAWMRALRDGVPLADALRRAGADFALEPWLLQALQQGWLWKAEPLAGNEENDDDDPLA